MSYSLTTTTCGGTQVINTWQNVVWTQPDGTQHAFPITTTQNQCTGVNTASGDAYATDSAGFHMYITNFTTATIFAKDGAQAYPSVKDTNGNYFSTDANGNAIDTLGRTQITKTVSGNTITLAVLNSQGSTSNYTITTTTVNVNTAFGQSGVTEYSGTFTAVQSITLPDNSKYSFTYDSGTTPGNYGLLATMTVREGGQITYAYTNFADSYGNINRWLNTRTLAGGTWTYAPQVLTTCAAGQTGCQQKLTFTKPSGDQQVWTFTLNNGAWNTQALLYNGSSSSGTLLKTVNTDFDFSNACPLAGCSGAAYVRPIRVTTIDPIPGSSISNKTELSYDSIYYGNLAAVKAWNYYAGTPNASPDRETDYTYLTSSAYVGKDIHDRPTNITVKNSAGSQMSQTLMSYDPGSLTSVTGVAHHDDTNYGTGNTVRGNVSQVQKWVSGSTYLTTTSYSYDTTGQMLQMTNDRGYIRTYSYADNFYTDNGANPPLANTPPAPTNAFVSDVTLVNLAGSPHIGYGYYFNTGKTAFEQDENQSRIYHHYLDSLDRETHTYDRKLINGTRGWKLTNYATATEWGIYAGITDTTPSTTCSSCRHDNVDFDSFGRGVITNTLINDPDGATYVQTVYGPVGRVRSVSNPYRSTSDPTYGVDTYSYDGLDRKTQTVHQDNNSINIYYGAAVSSSGGAASQLCSAATYGLGYPTLSVDEAGKKKQSWSNAFGNIIEADEPDASNALTVPTCYAYDALNNLTQVAQGTQTRAYAYDGLSRESSATEPESGATNFYFTTSAGAICSAVDQNVCRRADARGVTATYTYGSLDHLTSIAYSDATPTANYYWEQTSYNGLTITYPGGRRTGMSDGSGQTAWSYDPAGHVVTEQRTVAGITKQINYTYNVDGSVASIAYPSGRTIAYAYNNAQRPISAVDAANAINYATGATYAPQGALASVLHGQVSGGFAGITRSYGYNNRLQPATMTTSSANGTVQNLSYSFNLGGGLNNGSVASITNNLNTGRTHTFTYDNLNRIGSAQSQATSGNDCWGQSFGYDRYGNLLNVNATQCSAPTLSVGVNGSNQITNAGFTYDAAGNLSNDGANAYSWDAENRPKAAAGVSYTYDGDNWRVEKSNGELDWYSSACGHGPLFETDLSGNVTVEYVSLGSTRIARRDASGSIYFYFGDHIRSDRVMTTASGVTQQESDYYPFGAERVITNTVSNEHKFTGKKRDAESGLDYSRHMYHPNIARVIASRPAPAKSHDPQALNVYAYSRNNPTNTGRPVSHPNANGARHDFGGFGLTVGFHSGFCPSSLDLLLNFGVVLPPQDVGLCTTPLGPTFLLLRDELSDFFDDFFNFGWTCVISGSQEAKSDEERARYLCFPDTGIAVASINPTFRRVKQDCEALATPVDKFPYALDIATPSKSGVMRYRITRCQLNKE